MVNFCLLVSSVDNFSKQFGQYQAGRPTKLSVLFRIQMVSHSEGINSLKNSLKRVIDSKKTADDKTS